MELSEATETLSALSHEGRLAVFRLLVEAGPEGLAAGEISRRLGVPASSMSSSLAILERAGLVTSRRDGRSIIYAAGFAKMAALLAYLMKDCCAGSPQICAPIAEVANQAMCCVPTPS